MGEEKHWGDTEYPGRVGGFQEYGLPEHFDGTFPGLGDIEKASSHGKTIPHPQ